MNNLVVTLDDYLRLPIPPLSWLVQGLIPRQSFVVLWGPPKSGKTILSLDLGLSLANGQGFLGKQTYQAPCLVVELDTGQQMFRTILHSLGQTRNLHGPLYLPHPEELNKEYPLNLLVESSSLFLHSLITQVQPGLVIVDCLSEIGNHDENEQKSMKPIISALKHLTTFHPTHPCACLLLHHTVKFDYGDKTHPIPSPLKAGRGSGYLAGAADSIWFLHRITSDQDPHAVLKIVPRFGHAETVYLKQLQSGWWSKVG